MEERVRDNYFQRFERYFPGKENCKLVTRITRDNILLEEVEKFLQRDTFETRNFFSYSQREKWRTIYEITEVCMYIYAQQKKRKEKNRKKTEQRKEIYERSNDRSLFASLIQNSLCVVIVASSCIPLPQPRNQLWIMYKIPCVYMLCSTFPFLLFRISREIIVQ